MMIIKLILKLYKIKFIFNELDKLENLGFKKLGKKIWKINNYKYNKYVNKADYVIKFENMNEDIKILKEKLKINSNLEF